MAGPDLFGIYLEIIKGLDGHWLSDIVYTFPAYLALFYILSDTKLIVSLQKCAAVNTA